MSKPALDRGKAGAHAGCGIGVQQRRPAGRHLLRQPGGDPPGLVQRDVLGRRQRPARSTADGAGGPGDQRMVPAGAAPGQRLLGEPARHRVAQLHVAQGALEPGGPGRCRAPEHVGPTEQPMRFQQTMLVGGILRVVGEVEPDPRAGAARASGPARDVMGRQRVVEIVRAGVERQAAAPDRLTSLELVQADMDPGVVEPLQRTFEPLGGHHRTQVALLDPGVGEQSPVGAMWPLVDRVLDDGQEVGWARGEVAGDEVVAGRGGERSPKKPCEPRCEAQGLAGLRRQVQRTCHATPAYAAPQITLIARHGGRELPVVQAAPAWDGRSDLGYSRRGWSSPVGALQLGRGTDMTASGLSRRNLGAVAAAFVGLSVRRRLGCRLRSSSRHRR